MKVCPHCDSRFPNEEYRCPSCGAIYWEPEQESLTEESDVDADEEEGEGCLPMLLLPLFMAAATAFAFLLAGFLINLIVHFESSQIKILWIAGSCLLGFIAYSILTAIKKRKKQSRHKP